MITEIEYDFLRKFNVYMDLYKENKMPVILCDSEMNVGWRNPAAETLFPHITEKENFEHLISEFKKDDILKKIKSEGSVLLANLVGVSDVVLSLTPIIKGGGIYGIVAEFMGPNAVILKPKTRLISQTPMRIEAGIRESVTEIFRAMDIATLMEHMLLEKAELRELELDTGFISASFNSIAKQGYYLLRIAKNISVYSDLSANPPVPSFATEDIFEIVARTEDSVKLLAAEMNIPVSFSLPETNGIAGLDAEKFELAFFNILNNAFYFTRENNTVKITGSSDNDSVSITVTDHGTGIPKDILPDIFEPYFARGHQSKSAGIGLGLTIAKAMIEAQNGSITVDSIEGEGTEVTITIPRGIFARRTTMLRSSSSNLAADKFSYLYVGLVDAIRSPYNPKNSGDLK